MRDFVIAPGHGILIIPKRYLQEIFSVGRVPYKVIDCGLYLQHGLPGLDFFLHPRSANLVVMAEITPEENEPLVVIEILSLHMSGSGA